MRYLTVAADYTGSALRDDQVGSVVPEEVGLPSPLGVRMCAWNARYRAVMPLGPAERAERLVVELIDELDAEGLSLVTDIVTLRPDFKVRYFSEGLLTYLL